MYIVVIDQGTSSTRAMLFNLKGQIITQSAFPLTQYYPNPGWVEHCPEEIWEHTIKALKNICSQFKPSDILGIGITNQRETTVLWDKKTGRCLSKAIVWQDRRTQKNCDRLIKFNPIIRERTGLTCDPYFSATKIKWLLDAHPLSNDVLFGTIDTYLLWRLTKGSSHKTDITNASRTLLLNIHTHSWDEELLNIFQIPRHILPEVCSSDTHFGDVDASLLGFSCPVLAMIGDQQSALLGIGSTQPGDVKETYGTGGFVMLNTGIRPFISEHGLLTTIAYQIDNQVHYALEGNIYDAGSLMLWLKDQVSFIEDYQESIKLASSIDSSDGVFFIPSFSGIGAPHWISDCGASFKGLSRTTTKAHLVRAVMESIGFQTNDILRIMENDTHLPIHKLRIDGGMIHNHWFVQFLNQLCGKTIHIPNTFENTSKGAALITALSFVDEPDIQALSLKWQKETLLNRPPCPKSQMSYQNWQKEIQALKIKT